MGCIHTCQGLEFDYVGVIIGDDMRFENGRVVTDYTRRAKTDAALNGIKKLAKDDPERASRIADELIRNTYRVLMTRGMKGCFVFCTDPALADYLRSRKPKRDYAPTPAAPPLAAEDPLGGLIPMLEDLTRQILEFRDARDWKQFHSPKNLAASVSIEAAELLECFQWSNDETHGRGRGRASQ